MNSSEVQKRQGDRLVLGIDLGGTKIATALATDRGGILSRRQVPTPVSAGPEGVIEKILVTVEETLRQGKTGARQLLGIGIAAAGVIDAAKGMVVFSPNLPGWYEVPLGNIVQDHFGIPVCMGNDANLAALGEWSFGLDKKVSNLLYITVSTGIGGGIIANGRLYTGARGAAGEVGHMTVDIGGRRCNCGNTGCWETLASGTALAREAVRQVAQGRRTSMLGLVGGDASRIDARVISRAAGEGDELARELISQVGFYLGVGLVSLVNIFDPELILIGGGVSRIGDLLFQPAVQVVKERTSRMGAAAVAIKPALLGDDSCVLGAVAFVLEQLSTYSSE
ncbi:MAG: ROK family protein [Dehalococcoidia bacterium]|nr:ROK family protein [Dehalococcoidia bacterium]